jgi:anti-sigma B factor antagonist
MLRCPPDFLAVRRTETQIALEPMTNPEDEERPAGHRPAPRGTGPGDPGSPLRGELRPSGPVSLQLTETRRSGVSVIEVAGELDLLTASRMAALLDEVVRTRGQDDVVIDLRATAFIDSAGLQILLSAKRRLTRLSRELLVVSEAGPVRRVLELSRLIETLGVIDSLDDLPPKPQ